MHQKSSIHMLMLSIQHNNLFKYDQLEHQKSCSLGDMPKCRHE
jgi:hypothetical protein